MPDRRSRAPRIVVPRPDRIRTLEATAFGWLDARLHHGGWLRAMTPQALAVYAFLCLAADRRGVSFYRRERLARELGLDDVETAHSLARLQQLDLIAYRPFRAGAADGFHQVMALPAGGPRSPLEDAVAIDRLVAATKA